MSHLIPDDGNSGKGPPLNQEELALHVLHSLDQPICIVDGKDRFFFANKAYARQYEVGFETLKGVHIQELIGQALYDTRFKVLLQRARDEEETIFRGWLDLPEAGRRYVESDIRLYAHPGLANKGWLIIQTRDITDREELDRRRRHSLSFQEKLLGRVPAMVWICGSNGVPYFYNESWLNFSGLTLIEQMRDGWMGLVHPEEQKMVKDRIHYGIENGEEVQIEFRMRYLMGGYRWVRLFGRPATGLGDGNGDFVASALDIDDSKQMEIQMRAAIAEERHLREQALLQKNAADRANREKSAYLSLASHEIRTPMNPVIGFADLLASNPDLDVDSKEMAQMILKAGKNLMTLLDEVLDYAKMEAGVFKLSPEPMDIHDLLSEVEGLYAYDAKSRGIEFRIRDRVKGEHEMYQDRLRLEQVLGTLITNSIKMTHTGRVTLEADIEEIPGSANNARILQLTVRDTGMGMSSEELDKLFQPFARQDSEFTDKYGGAGLGLAIAQKLIDSMQGRIQATSKPGKGTTVKLEIPFNEVPAHLKRPEKGQKEPMEKGAGDQDSAKIIIVDDEESSRLVNASLIRFLGHKCEVVGSGEELLNKLRKQSYEMILIDIMMPGVDGLEATRRIRDGEFGEANRAAFIIAVTACALEEDRKRALKAGVNAYLTKPLTIESLRESIESYHAMGRSI